MRDLNPRSQYAWGQEPLLSPRGHCDRHYLLAAVLVTDSEPTPQSVMVCSRPSARRALELICGPSLWKFSYLIVGAVNKIRGLSSDTDTRPRTFAKNYFLYFLVYSLLRCK